MLILRRVGTQDKFAEDREMMEHANKAAAYNSHTSVQTTKEPSAVMESSQSRVSGADLAIH